MHQESGHLKRRLGLTSAISITVGAVIGSGIFMKPLSVAQSLPSEGWIFALWIGLGLVCLFGAFAYAELGAMFPEAGGQYAFLREGWGPAVGFLYGWVFFWAINSGTMAALATAFAEYLLPLLQIDKAAHPLSVVGVASLMIFLLATVNHFGVTLGALLQNLSTFAKLGALGLIVLGGAFAAAGHGVAPTTASDPAVQSLKVSGLLTAFTGIFWAYEGWYQLPFNAAELRRPERHLPQGLIFGMLLLIVTYTAVNAIYLEVVPFAEMRQLPAGADQQVPYLAVMRIFSPQVAAYLTLLVAISVMGAANPNLLCSSRAFYAMGQDGLVPKRLNWIHPRHGTPSVAIWSQALWAILLVLYLKEFHDITAFVVFASFLFYAMTVAAVWRLRRRLPDHPRPYRCTGYPLTPALFILVTVAFVVTLLLDPVERHNALVGLAILAAGVPYYWWRKRAVGAARGEG
ncbi:APC family permease [Methyloterricola oryzae]|uniref:APC family permease n=1 Tax=Methyloterricola oryzae TaxID=1495050 RepID=UPI0005EB2C93|nr:amino acid permease [Methyloterricola oryzae]